MHLVLIQMARFDLEFVQKTLGKMPKRALVLFPEYVLTPFFLELLEEDARKIHQHSCVRLEQLQDLALKHRVHFVAPVVLQKEQGLYKQMAWVSPESVQFYTQQKLMGFDHWDEAGFFANPQTKIQAPLSFTLESIKIALLFGYELHFDAIWLEMQKQGVDMVLLSTASTFESSERWRTICMARAFCNSMLIARANRIGMVRQAHYPKDNPKRHNIAWRFYGDSFIALPNGQIVDSLQGEEGVLHLEVQKNYLDAWAQEWGFRNPNPSVGENHDR